MRILLITFYYPPDLSAGAFRSREIVKALRAVAPRGSRIDVMSTTPNRYASFGGSIWSAESSGEDCDTADSVERLPVSGHRSGLLDQAWSFAGFALRAVGRVRTRQYDVVIATSSRLFTGTLGAIVARRVSARFYLDIRDLFVMNMAELYRSSLSIRLVMLLVTWLEKFTVSRAVGLNLVSEGFLPYYRMRFPQRRFTCYTNGVDSEFVDFRASGKDGECRRLLIVYAGNMGVGQGLERLIPQAAARLADWASFRLLGAGGRQQALVDALRIANVDNVEVLPPVDRESLMRVYSEADVLLLNLNDAEALEHVIPSKVFEYAATGKPIIAGLRGYARAFVEREVPNVRFFDPCDPSGLVEAVRSIRLGHTDRSAFVQKYRRDRIMKEMATDILRISSDDD